MLINYVQLNISVDLAQNNSQLSISDAVCPLTVEVECCVCCSKGMQVNNNISCVFLSMLPCNISATIIGNNLLSVF